MALDEFALIETFFQNTAARSDVLLGIGDDCAIVQPPPNKNLLITTDTLNVGSHFLPETPPFDIGYKAVAVSLSDMAAMGGEPAWLLLSLTLPDADSHWLKGFSQGLFSCLKKFNVDLIGGNMCNGPLAVTTQLTGFVERGEALLRSNAQPGDLIYVTHTLGGAALALAILNNKVDPQLFTAAERQELMQQLLRPTPRILEGQLIRLIAHAAIDISDGLLADLNHILKTSGVGATLSLEKIPLSPCLSMLTDDLKYPLALSGGDDYELCFCLPPTKQRQWQQLCRQHQLKASCIGAIEQQQGLRIKTLTGEISAVSPQGYQHF